MARTRGAVTASNSQARIDFSGPFFENDPEKTFAENVRKMLQAVVDEGAQTVVAKSPRRTGAFAGGIVGRVRSVHGAPWWQNGVVSATHIYPWHEHRGESINRDRGRVGANRGNAEYRGGKIEAKYHMFRQVAGQMRRSRAVLVANLTEGLE